MFFTSWFAHLLQGKVNTNHNCLIDFEWSCDTFAFVRLMEKYFLSGGYLEHLYAKLQIICKRLIILLKSLFCWLFIDSGRCYTKHKERVRWVSSLRTLRLSAFHKQSIPANAQPPPPALAFFDKWIIFCK